MDWNYSFYPLHFIRTILRVIVTDILEILITPIIEVPYTITILWTLIAG